MGLDTVELVMAIEEEFEIEISDSDAEKMRTVGDLVDYVHGKIVEMRKLDGVKGEPIEKIDEDFRKLHDAKVTAEFIEKFPHLDGATPVKLLFPLCDRRSEWNDFVNRIGCRMLSLRRPISVVILIWIISIGAPVYVSWPRLGIVFYLFLFAILMSFILTRPLKRNFPIGVMTFGELLQATWEAAPRDGLKRIYKAGLSREAVKIEVVSIIVDQLGVHEDQCTDDAKFVEDLGIE